MWLNEEYTEYHRYDEPKGAAIKVTATEGEHSSNWFDRFVLFYLTGE